MDDPLALTDAVVPTSDDDERELERAAEFGAAYWRHVVERRRALEASVRRDRTRSVTPPPSVRLAPRPSPPPIPEPDVSALLAFQNARTFRPRTALQLQPYTRERLAYQAVVRRGGGRGLVRDLDVAPPVDGEESEEDGVYQETADPLEIEPTPVLSPESQDYSQYTTLHPHAPTPSPTDPRLQALVKERLQAAKAERRRRRQERDFARRVEEDIREREREARKERRRAAGNEKETPTAREKTKRPRVPPVDVTVLLRGLSASSGSSPSPSPSPDRSKRKKIRHRIDQDPMDLDDAQIVQPDPDPEEEAITLLSSDSSSGTETETPTTAALPRDKARALRHMLPAFMVKRLPQNTAAKRTRPAGRRDNEDGEDGPRPGRARVRPAPPERQGALERDAGAEAYGHDSMGMFDDLEMDDEPRPLSPPPMLSPPKFPGRTSPGFPARPPFPTFTRASSPSTISSSSDDDGATSVRLLRAGDFSRLLNGERDAAPRARTTRRTGAGNALLRAARTARGTVRRARAGKPKGGKGPEQSRLPFPQAAAGRPAAKKNHRRARPRQVLDDHTIFEVSEDEPLMDEVPVVHERPASSPAPPRVVRARPRVSAHAPVTPRAAPRPITTNRNAPVSTPATITVSHKASLWTDLQDFQVDFDVKPLPSGVSFAADTWLGSAGLERYLDSLSDPAPPPAPPVVVVFGISLTDRMPYAELLQLLPTLMNGVHDQILAQCNGRAPTEPEYMATFEFLDRYMVAHAAHHSTDEAIRLIQDVLERLTGIRSSRRASPDDRQHLYLVDASLAIFKLLLRIYFHWPQAAASLTLETSIQIAAQNIMERLLIFGFDRTMKPLKAIMAFAADSPVLSDFTAECWITLIHLLRAMDSRDASPTLTGSFSRAMDTVVQRLYVDNHAGPRASERIWYITFGLAAFHQFGVNGVTLPDLQDYPQWPLVRKALSLIKFPDYSEAEEHEKRHQLKSRDKYIKIMVIRCLQLTCTWQWRCDRDSFAIATRDLGNLFKERHLRNLPNEASSDFSAFIREYDLKRSSEVDIEESTYNLYLQLVCVSASDLIAGARDMKEAEQSVKDVQKLMLAIFPFSPVVPSSNGVFSGKQLGALVNRFSALVVAVLFVPSLLEYLLNVSRKWIDFNCGDIEVQRICLRGLMYVGVAARHHASSVEPVVNRLADIFETVHATKRSLGAHQGDKIREQERLLILLVSCYRQIIERHSFDRDLQQQPAYPDPCLLHKCWTSRLSSTDLITDRRAGLEVIETIQAFLDRRVTALPDHIRSMRQQKQPRDEESQQSEFDSIGIAFTTEDLLMLGEEMGDKSPIIEKDKALAEIIATHISPGIYELLSNTFSSNDLCETDAVDVADTQSWISKLTKCWADCASVLVVDHHLREWSYYINYGQESYMRLADEAAKRRVGTSFFLNVLHMDPAAFNTYPEDFAILFAQALVVNQVTIEHEYASALMHSPASRQWYLLYNFPARDWSRESFLAERRDMVGILSVNISLAMRAADTKPLDKAFMYRLVNIMLGTMQHNYQTIPAQRTDLRRQYSMFCNDVIAVIKRHNPTTMNEMTVIKLKSFPLYTDQG